jgi:hypothetical protein
MKPNLNFHNEYYVTIQSVDRLAVLALFKKMSDSKPGLFQDAKIRIKDNVKGTLDVYIGNMSAFDVTTKNVILKFLNTFKYKKPDITENNC